MKARRFVDSVVVAAQAGNGGNGCVSFRREKYEPRGGPDGGDGGRGGDVVLRADADTDSLVALYYSPSQSAAHGGHGRGKRQHGRNGGDLILRVPCGTEARDNRTGRVIGEVVEHGAQLVVARGGKGGLGNCHWKTSSHRAPREHTDGERGAGVVLRLDLKLVADIGLVGFPNAGKSSLLSRISDAHPKIAAYPFTTLHPVIGTVVFDDYSRVTVADIPGLVENAHEGAGLGDRFLRHVERAACLIYVLDMAGVDGRSPAADYRNLRAELAAYRADLVNRPGLLVANKMDLPEAADNLAAFQRRFRARILPLSAATGDGIGELKSAIRALTSSDSAGTPGLPCARGPGARA